MKRFRRGFVFKAHRRLFHSNLGSRVIKMKKRELGLTVAAPPVRKREWPVIAATPDVSSTLFEVIGQSAGF